MRVRLGCSGSGQYEGLAIDPEPPVLPIVTPEAKRHTVYATTPFFWGGEKGALGGRGGRGIGTSCAPVTHQATLFDGHSVVRKM